MPVYCDFLPETAKKWRISERSVRNYCALGKIAGAFLTGKTWAIPDDAQKPDRANKKVKLPTTLLEVLVAEKKAKLSGGIYHKVQIEFTYNSNHMEGSRLTHDQTRDIFEKNTIGISVVFLTENLGRYVHGRRFAFRVLLSYAVSLILHGSSILRIGIPSCSGSWNA